MLKLIFCSAVSNAKRFFVIWLIILVVNQFFVFGACFAPYCLTAALPHTLLLAFLFNFFGFRRRTFSKTRRSSFSADSEYANIDSSDRSQTKKLLGSRNNITRGFRGALVMFFISGIIFVVFWFSYDFSEKSNSQAISIDMPASNIRLTEDIPDERALPQDIIDGEVLQSYYEGASETGGYREDDEFDDNDIETYERLTGKIY